MANYDKTNPYLASLTERYSLCRSGSKKNTYHLILDLKGSGIQYEVGDSIAIFPTYETEIVSRLIKRLGASGAEPIIDKQSGATYSLHDYLAKKANLGDVSRKLIGEIAKRQTNLQKKEQLEFLISEGQKEALKNFQATHEVWDTLEENFEVVFSPQELCQLLQPLLPRFYSIASSMASVGEEVHLTVAEVVYETNSQQRRGVCTHFLCNTAPLHERSIPIYIQSSHGFAPPSQGEAAAVMIGPGTGVAPFRAFMQEREAKGAEGKNWLFFGEWHRDHHFYYEMEWERHIQAGRLRVDTAFSRDQEHKVYVQHRMLENGAELFALMETGGHFYVCGDAQKMAKDVDAALHQIVEKHAVCSPQAAKDYIKQLKSAKRYLRDVY